MAVGTGDEVEGKRRRAHDRGARHVHRHPDQSSERDGVDHRKAKFGVLFAKRRHSRVGAQTGNGGKRRERRGLADVQHRRPLAFGHTHGWERRGAGRLLHERGVRVGFRSEVFLHALLNQSIDDGRVASVYRSQSPLLAAPHERSQRPLDVRVVRVDRAQLDLIQLHLEPGSDLGERHRFRAAGHLVGVVAQRDVVRVVGKRDDAFRFPILRRREQVFQDVRGALSERRREVLQH
mmetsp:Transcript_7745/g.32913  ORF Transcript_7745/g.32913 Transcript_7745/m.32913 type:complete len:235 (-) Transcript_7745:668-1372(-)